MPTVMLTTSCPNECPWCFARPKMSAYGESGSTAMAWGDFLKVADFYEHSGVRHMALLGGEPTRHSPLLEILTCLRELKDAPFPCRSSYPSFMIDIGPRPEAWPCFPLSEESYRLQDSAPSRTFAAGSPKPSLPGLYFTKSAAGAVKTGRRGPANAAAGGFSTCAAPSPAGRLWSK